MNLISWYKHGSSELENRKARRAFETVLILAAKQPDTERYRQFSSEVKALQERKINESSSIGKLVCFICLNVHMLCFCLLMKGQSVCCYVLRCCSTLCIWIKSYHRSK